MDRLLRAMLPEVRADSNAEPGEADTNRIRSTAAMTQPDFAPIADSLRRSVISFYAERGETLEVRRDVNTLETNSGFVERRANPLLELLFLGTGSDSLDGMQVLDLGCGFGALSLYFAAHGGLVTGIDPIEQRLGVGRDVAAAHELGVRFETGRMEELKHPDASFDLAVQNNSLCYIVAGQDRDRALRETLRVLRPGGYLIVRNPNRWHPLDQFTGLPLVQLLPATRTTQVAERPRQKAFDGAADLASRGGARTAQGRLHRCRARRLAGKSLAQLRQALRPLPAPARTAAEMTDRENTQVQLERPSDSPDDGHLGVHEALGARLSRDTSIYVIGSVILFVLAFISVIVTTHFLTPPEFGELALLMVFAAFLTIVYNTGIVQGTLVWVFGAAGEEEVDDAQGETAAAGTKRRALGTGLATTLGITLIGTVVMVALSPWLADLMLGDSGRSQLIILAAVSGAAGAMWRMVSNILRMERKPRRYVVLNSVRPVLVVGITIPLIASGGGVEGAILGTAIGSCLSVAVGLLVTRPSYVIALDTTHLRRILGQGAPYIPIVLSIWIVQNLDLYAVSWWTNNDQVGLYRLANRYGAFLDYFTAALFMAWAPLRATSTFQAVTAERPFEALGGALLTYFVLAGLLLILLMTVAADTLVRVAPPAYAAAAPLIPLMGASFLSYGLYVAIYRLSSFPWKRAAYSGSTMASAAFFLPAAAVLVPWLGASGAALSVIVSFLFGTAVMTYLSQRGPSALDIEYRRIATALLLAAVCIGLARGVAPHAGSWAPAVEMLAFFLFCRAPRARCGVERRSPGDRTGCARGPSETLASPGDRGSGAVPPPGCRARPRDGGCGALLCRQDRRSSWRPGGRNRGSPGPPAS